MIEQLVANLAFKTVQNIFLNGSDKEARNPTDNLGIRLKNLYPKELILFIELWDREAAHSGLGRVKLIVSWDSDLTFNDKYRAHKDTNITYYRVYGV